MAWIQSKVLDPSFSDKTIESLVRWVRADCGERGDWELLSATFRALKGPRPNLFYRLAEELLPTIRIGPEEEGEEIALFSFCEKCFRTYNPDAQSCENCGEELDVAEYNPTQHPKPQD